MVTDRGPARQTVRAGRMFLALFLITAFALAWNSHIIDTVDLGLDALMWWLMFVEARRELARITTTDPPDERF